MLQFHKMFTIFPLLCVASQGNQQAESSPPVLADSVSALMILFLILHGKFYIDFPFNV